MSSDPPRPPHRKKRLTVPMDDETYDKALAKAGALDRLRAVARWFFDLWGSDEWPGPSEDEIQEQLRRAKKIPRKKKK